MCLDRPPRNGGFFPLVTDIGPHGIELNSGQVVVSQKQSLNLFNMSRCFAEPIHNCLFLYSFYSMDGGQAVPFGKHSQTFKDLLWAVMQAIKYGPFISHEHSAARFAFQTLRTLGSAAVPDYVSMIHFAIVGTGTIPAKRTCYC
jgi:hypothetical protein